MMGVEEADNDASLQRGNNERQTGAPPATQRAGKLDNAVSGASTGVIPVNKLANSTVQAANHVSGGGAKSGVINEHASQTLARNVGTAVV